MPRTGRSRIGQSFAANAVPISSPEVVRLPRSAAASESTVSAAGQRSKRETTTEPSASGATATSAAALGPAMSKAPTTAPNRQSAISSWNMVR